MSVSTALLAALLASGPAPATNFAPAAAAPAATLTPCPVVPAGPVLTAPAAPLDQPAASAPSATSDTAPDPAEIVVSGQLKAPKEDPLRAVNAQSFAVINKIDGVLIGPLAMAYQHAVPKPARDGVHNALSNLTEPVVFVNDLLQLKPGRAAKTLLRFVINSTLGLGGLFDVAKQKPFKLPHHNNGFGDTLGYYGVGPGPYLYLPLIGPTTVRDLVGRTLDLSLLPAAVGAPFNNPRFTLPNSAAKSLDDRVMFDRRQRSFQETADPYAAERSYYLQVRANEIAGLHGRHPELIMPLPGDENSAPPPPVCTAPAPPPAPAAAAPHD